MKLNERLAAWMVRRALRGRCGEHQREIREILERDLREFTDEQRARIWAHATR